MDNPIDNIGKNEELLRASKDFQKLGEGKKRRRLLKEAQRKDGTLKALNQNLGHLKELKKRELQKKREEKDYLN